MGRKMLSGATDSSSAIVRRMVTMFVPAAVWITENRPTGYAEELP